MMRVYVAAKFEEGNKVKEVYKKLAALGIGITHNWTDEDASKYKGNDLLAFKTECAENDRRGVLHAHAVLVLNHERLFGGAAEMGMALAMDIPVYVVNPEIRENIFFHLPDVQTFEDVDLAIKQIKEDHDSLYV